MAFGATSIRIMPPDRTKVVNGQLFDIRVEATSSTTTPPAGLKVFLDGKEITADNFLDIGKNGERGFGGTGTSMAAGLPSRYNASAAPANTSNFLLRGTALNVTGTHTLEARTTDGGSSKVTWTTVAWTPTASPRARAKNIILLLGDGMGAAHRTAARVLSRGYTQGKANGLLAMDTMEATGMVMTSSLNALITDSAPGMASYVTGSKSNNNQEGVFPDNTLADAFDNPRMEYLGEFLRRQRGKGFNVGIVSTADLTDATPAANAVHTANRSAGAPLAAMYFDERERNGVSVLLGGGRPRFQAPRNLISEFQTAGFTYVSNATELKAAKNPTKLIGLFHPSHMNVAFDKIGYQKGYSLQFADPSQSALRDQPMLDDMARSAIDVLNRTSPDGFYLMVEGASIDKRAHDLDAERSIWDTIEFDNAVKVALDFAKTTNTDSDPTNDTLVIVTADHECAGMALMGVGNEKYYPRTSGSAVRHYVATLRFATIQQLELFPNYVQDSGGYPVNPDPTRKLIIGWGAGPDRYENFMSNRYEKVVSVIDKNGVAIANPDKDGNAANSDNTTVDGKVIPGMLIAGTIENGENFDKEAPGDTSSQGINFADHTASDIPLSASGPGAKEFTGTYDNTETFFKMLMMAAGQP